MEAVKSNTLKRYPSAIKGSRMTADSTVACNYRACHAAGEARTRRASLHINTTILRATLLALFYSDMIVPADMKWTAVGRHMD
ncbi:hypothetical protein M5W83_18025 [Paenibacillus thiaminolyticus]|uniref:Uncharacterized protein n=1 Tax=Paenibacillus thiaminolyticus TaxID=49283 RepID=A0ABT4FZN3_PANTH|nr:hypothetical protein [Paenibacillus thiaminolyticus]MCY9538240.1 hypothetical protein [Paenibacillus thiaminolyticus]MCY9601621.1 hypothetical protein [Paenibacillus thiaminolyticus]MCY9609046.1 hypothetical protein [Paenibacillus thiaminolyticus]MCY9615571.1 hypothetical protein [Paenibacillus thiaminolyticus]MCY9620373.1 hypothetical protein [Paenibacillus thiaminolyticus]